MLNERERLLKAIELAEGYGEGSYVRCGRPWCVIGQLYALDGGDIDEMYDWAGKSVCHHIISTKLKYSANCLIEIQDIWDRKGGRFGEVPDQAKAKMVEVVDRYYPA